MTAPAHPLFLVDPLTGAHIDLTTRQGEVTHSGRAILEFIRFAQLKHIHADEPWCNHDPAAVIDGVCECGMPVATPVDTD